jgi:hypothetical protein
MYCETCVAHSYDLLEYLKHEGNTEEENNGCVVLNEISTADPLGNRVVVREGGVTPPALTPFYSRLLDRYLKTT